MNEHTFVYRKTGPGTATLVSAVAASGDVSIPARIELRGEILNVTRIASRAFQSNECLNTVVFPDTVETIGASAFRDCCNIRAVIFGKGLVSIEQSAFARCGRLKVAVFYENVQSIGSFAFANCESLDSIFSRGADIQDKVSHLGNNAFHIITHFRRFREDMLPSDCDFPLLAL